MAYMDYTADLDSLGFRPANLDFTQLPYITRSLSRFRPATSSSVLDTWISLDHPELLPAYLDHTIYLPTLWIQHPCILSLVAYLYLCWLLRFPGPILFNPQRGCLSTSLF